MGEILELELGLISSSGRDHSSADIVSCYIWNISVLSLLYRVLLILISVPLMSEYCECARLRLAICPLGAFVCFARFQRRF